MKKEINLIYLTIIGEYNMSKNDNKIKSLLTQIKTKKTKIGQKPKGNWVTNGIFKDTYVEYKNINVLDTDTCVSLLSTLIKDQECRDKACSLLDVSGIELTYNGFSFEDWVHDFKMRVCILKWDIEKRKLISLENKLKSLRSEDAKTEDAILDVMNELKQG